MVTFVFFLDSVSFFTLKNDLIHTDLHHRTIGKKKEKKPFIWKCKLWLLKKTAAQRGSWTQNPQPTRRCALGTPADSGPAVTCPRLGLAPSPASSLHTLVGCQVWLGASFAAFSSAQSASLGRTGAGDFVVASEMISQKAVTHHRKPCLFSLWPSLKLPAPPICAFVLTFLINRQQLTSDFSQQLGVEMVLGERMGYLFPQQCPWGQQAFAQCLGIFPPRYVSISTPWLLQNPFSHVSNQNELSHYTKGRFALLAFALIRDCFAELFF